MPRAAGVLAFDALRDFRGALLAFLEAANDAVLESDTALARTLDWIQHDQPLYWKAKVRQREDEVQRAKADLDRCLTTTMFGHPAGCTDQKKALAAAKRRLEAAQDKLKAVLRWARTLDAEVEDFQGPKQQFQTLLDGDIRKGIDALARILDTLEQYTQVAPAVSSRQELEALDAANMARGGGDTSQEPAVSAEQQAWTETIRLLRLQWRDDGWRKQLLDPFLAIPQPLLDVDAHPRPAELNAAVQGWLHQLRQHADLPPLDHWVVLDPAATAPGATLFAQRLSPVADRDSGWLVASGELKVRNLQWAPLSMDNLRKKWPWLWQLLIWPVGHCAMATVGGPIKLFDAQDQLVLEEDWPWAQAT